jgi:UDP-glucose 4-epimerase
MKILLTGGAGFIGSHTAVECLESGYEVVILDNFVNSKPSVIDRIEKIAGHVILEECDLLDKSEVGAVFEKHAIDAVVHFAGLKAVGESVSKPQEYYRNNLIGTLNLLEAMTVCGVRKLIFSSSATVYRSDNPVPYFEDFPLGATNPYGWTKVMIEQILRDICDSDPAWAVCSLRYFNPIGAHQSGLIGEDPHGTPNNLLPYIAKVASGELPEIHIFGDDYDTPDGTGVRDYIHVMDLARGHLFALDYLKDRTGIYSFNLGTGVGYSVKDVINAFEKVCGKSLPFVIDPRRPGDLPSVYANADLADDEFGFRTRYDLAQMCEDAWRWQQYSNKNTKT